MQWILLLLLCLTTLVAVAASATGILRLGAEQSEGILRRREEVTRQALRELFIRDITPRQVEILTLSTAAIVAVLLQLLIGNPLIAAAAGIGIFFLPRPFFSYLRFQRLRKFEEQLPDALSFLSNSTKAGLSLTQAIEEVTQQAPVPISEEFSLILQDNKLGTDLGAAIEAARNRLGSRNFNLVASALLVSREKGGNLPEALDTMAASLKEIWRTEQKLITASAEGRKAVWVISGMPLAVLLMIGLLQPQIVETLVTDFLGMIVLFISTCLYVGGLSWLMRVLRIDV
ncbi:MAG: hypothetical protein HKP27_04020 [Myxococcales bacterium]|nr:hypothetical protein [Myxococcales bacterium]